MAARCGELADNLVLKAAYALSERVAGLKVGRFLLSKRLPVAAGLGGGSSDAAAALRLLARANHLALEDPRLIEAAQATGADVPVCLDPQTRVMRGIGDVLSDRIKLAPLPAILVNPGVMVATGEVFRALELSRPAAKVAGLPISSGPQDTWVGWGSGLAALVAGLASVGNDLEKPAIRLRPVIADVLQALATLPGCRLARMSGSGAPCDRRYARPVKGPFSRCKETVRTAGTGARRGERPFAPAPAARCERRRTTYTAPIRAHRARSSRDVPPLLLR